MAATCCDLCSVNVSRDRPGRLESVRIDLILNKYDTYGVRIHTQV